MIFDGKKTILNANNGVRYDLGIHKLPMDSVFGEQSFSFPSLGVTSFLAVTASASGFIRLGYQTDPAAGY
jgi:hypothetical protein